MITGHFAVAWFARARRPMPSGSVPFAALLVASILPDLVDTILSVGKVCNRHGVYTHTLPAIAVIAVAVWLGSYVVWRNLGFSTLMLVVVLLHVPADWITGRKLLWANGPMLQLRIYRWPCADFLLEASIVVLAWRAFARATATPRWAATRVALVSLVLLQGAFDIGLPTTRRINREARHRACGELHTPQGELKSGGIGAEMRGVR